MTEPTQPASQPRPPPSWASIVNLLMLLVVSITGLFGLTAWIGEMQSSIRVLTYQMTVMQRLTDRLEIQVDRIDKQQQHAGGKP